MTTINKIGRGFGKALLTRGMEILKSSVPLNPKEITSAKARAIMKEYFPTAEYVFMDSKYKVVSADEWKILDEDIREVTKKMWEAEFYDCDEKAYVHKYWTLRIFGIPQFAIVGDVYDLQGQFMFHHLFNGRIVDNEIYIFEPDGGLLEKAEKGQNFIKFGGRKYFPKTIEF